MAENNCSSQESLPLSQETCLQLYSLIGGPISNFMEDDTVDDQAYTTLVSDINRIQATVNLTPVVNDYSNNYPNNIINQQDLLQVNHTFEESQYKGDSIKWSPVPIPIDDCENGRHEHFSEQKRPVSSLLGSEIWPGKLNFTVSFTKMKIAKGVSWIFSTERNKLYVDKNVPCPVNFAANIPMHEEIYYIRAMALFSSSDFAFERVTRCVNHSMDDIRKNIFEAEHFIRCESKNAVYENDPITDRHSVIVPYENPPAGQAFSTYLYKFMCFGSCAGGPNRRGLIVVFTLERRNGEVVGRQKIEIKVCACPMRDYNADEKKPVLKEQRSVKKHKSVSDFPQPPKKIKEEPNVYRIETTDKKRYKFLKKMETLHILYSAAKDQPNWRQLLYMSSQSSSGESEN